MTDVDASALIDDFERAGPSALALSRMFSLRKPQSQKRRGRPPDDLRIKVIHNVVTQLMHDRELSEKEAIRQAPAVLYGLGIEGYGPVPRPMNPRSVRDALKKYARLWFDPIDETSGS
ncbi:hypothetical protein LB518_10140 [Mesorhizobium sp. BR1-1-16]|uniref:hypothetical protein n=1 Tax=Mesorhizobium sp. BR1-1-16 TaxID=2876653 RepID=UPI001CCBFD77|nr:hypothetical protein [Mesorhizobium sp. BR1-1-16]MBZ9936655.1 hypothetical protein [Mesorhizobium sp. BR1-1-16]